MGRFTLRDEGKTIALGKITKYKPSKPKTAAEEKKEEEAKKNNEFLGIKPDKKDGEEGDEEEINTNMKNLAVEKEVKFDRFGNKIVEAMYYDMDSGELMTQDEKRKASLNAIDEDEYDEEEDENADAT
jgi:hypothetical protein